MPGTTLDGHDAIELLMGTYGYYGCYSYCGNSVMTLEYLYAMLSIVCSRWLSLLWWHLYSFFSRASPTSL
jgi:hypothetical protein